MFMTRFLRRIGVFKEDTEGSMSVEAVLMLPLLTWVFLATYTYFDAYRAKSINLKAAYTVGDVISRETQPIDQDYLDTLQDLFTFLTFSREAPNLRVTVVSYNYSDEEFEIEWSNVTGNVSPLTSTDLDELEAALPPIPLGESVIVVESWMDHEPPFTVGLNAFSMNNFIVTRPRFAPQVIWES